MNIPITHTQQVIDMRWKRP